MKQFCILLLAAMVVATTLPEIQAQYGRGGGRKMRRNGLEGMHRFRRDIDHMLELNAASSAEDEAEPARGFHGAFDVDGLGILPGFEESLGRYRFGDQRRKSYGEGKDFGITFDE